MIPATPPAAVKTGPPAPPEASLKSALMSCASTRLTIPVVMPFSWREGTPMVKSSCPFTTAGFAV